MEEKNYTVTQKIVGIIWIIFMMGLFAMNLNMFLVRPRILFNISLNPLEIQIWKIFVNISLVLLSLLLIIAVWKVWEKAQLHLYLKRLALVLVLTFLVIFFVVYNLETNAVYYANKMKHNEYSDPVLIAMMDFARTTDFPKTVTYKQNYVDKEIKAKNFGGYSLYRNDGSYHSVFDSPYTFRSDELFMKISDQGCFEIYTMSFLNKPGYKVLNDEECLRSIQGWVKKTEEETLKKYSKPFINLQFLYNSLYEEKFK